MRAPITMSLMGGLGNQLFQFATGLEVSQRAQAPLRLDLSWFEQSHRRARNGLVLRPYELEGLADDIVKVSGPEGTARALARHGVDVLARRAAPVVNRLPLHGFAEVGSAFDPRALEVPAGTHMWGYFASWRYFPNVAGDIRRRILGSGRLSSSSTDEAQRASRDGVVAVHVRRGDYLSLASMYGHVSPHYYLRAINLIRSLGHDGPVWLFSDDPVGAARFLAGTIAVNRVVEPPDGASSLDSLVAMSGARALVTANSTFSWWAAFVRDNADRPVVAPRPAWADSSLREPRDGLLPNWLTVDCRDQAELLG